jgi:CRISPR-associated endonuclease/helicase Cas3
VSSGYFIFFAGKPRGKPGISVRDHCLNVGCVAEALVRLLPKPLQDLLPRGAITLAALHDVGKITPGLRRRCACCWPSNRSIFAKAWTGWCKFAASGLTSALLCQA